jgi:hypothetical protein
MLAYDYPILGLFWTMLIFFLWFAWIMLVFRIFADVFRSHDMGGLSKGLWCVFVIILPLLGVLIYLIVRGDSMVQRDVAAAKADEAAFRDYVQNAAGGGTSTAAELSKLAELHSAGVLTDDEFAQQKAKLLA